jgi:hypothetical protein
MKHILNNISQEEKNRILEQHKGGKSIDTTRFKSLLESTMGNVKPLISETEYNEGVTVELETISPNVAYFTTNPKGVLLVDDIGSVLATVNNETIDEKYTKMYSDQVVKGGEYQYEFVPLEKTMRVPTGEPVVKLFQNGQQVNSFMPAK